MPPRRLSRRRLPCPFMSVARQALVSPVRALASHVSGLPIGRAACQGWSRFSRPPAPQDGTPSLRPGLQCASFRAARFPPAAVRRPEDADQAGRRWPCPRCARVPPPAPIWLHGPLARATSRLSGGASPRNPGGPVPRPEDRVPPGASALPPGPPAAAASASGAALTLRARLRSSMDGRDPSGRAGNPRRRFAGPREDPLGGSLPAGRPPEVAADVPVTASGRAPPCPATAGPGGASRGGLAFPSPHSGTGTRDGGPGGVLPGPPIPGEVPPSHFPALYEGRHSSRPLPWAEPRGPVRPLPRTGARKADPGAWKAGQADPQAGRAG
jgi:hypothetical protein